MYLGISRRERQANKLTRTNIEARIIVGEHQTSALLFPCYVRFEMPKPSSLGFRAMAVSAKHREAVLSQCSLFATRLLLQVVASLCALRTFLLTSLVS